MALQLRREFAYAPATCDGARSAFLGESLVKRGASRRSILRDAERRRKLFAVGFASS
jgi:hypothetical protein